MPIGTPILAATANNTALGTSTTLTTAVPTYALVVVFVVDPNAAGLSATGGVNDSTGNIYLPAAASAPGAAFGCSLYYCQNAVAIPVGGTFTVSGLSGQTQYSGGMVYITGANSGIDKTNSGSATGTSLSIATGTLGASNEIVVGVMNSNNGLTGATDGGGFTSLTRAVFNTDFGYQIVSSNASVSYTVSGFTSGNAAGCVASFQQGDVPYQTSRVLFV
jgi:hypothetical protein